MTSNLLPHTHCVRVALLTLIAAASGSCGGGDIAGPPDDPAPPAVASVELAPANLNLTVGLSAQLTATPRAADGTPLADMSVTWATGNPGIASVSETGSVTAVATGEAQITATSGGKTGMATVTVSAEAVATVEVVPNPSSVSVGQTAQLVAVLKADSGEELPGRPVAWASSDEAVATVSATGLVTGVAAGQATITATSEGKSGSSQVTVSAVPVASVEVNPPSPSIAEGATVQLTAAAKDGHGQVLPGRPATWSSDKPAVARVSPTGLVTGVSAGNATLTATIEGKTGTAAVTVTPAGVATVEVTPVAPSVSAGMTVQLTATAKDANGKVLAGRTFTWLSSATGVATVTGSGLVRGVAPGSATITATTGGKSETARVSVTAAVGGIRTWKGGTTGKARDWSAAGNWNPIGAPTALDTARVPAVSHPAVLEVDARIARLIVAGGRIRTAGHRLLVKAVR